MWITPFLKLLSSCCSSNNKPKQYKRRNSLGGILEMMGKKNSVAIRFEIKEENLYSNLNPARCDIINTQTSLLLKLSILREPFIKTNEVL